MHVYFKTNELSSTYNNTNKYIYITAMNCI